MLPSSAVPITDHYTDYSHKQYGACVFLAEFITFTLSPKSFE